MGQLQKYGCESYHPSVRPCGARNSSGMDDRKSILKIIRLSLKTLNEHYGPKGSKQALQLWEGFTRNFRSKVDQWKSLSHANVVQILDFDEGLGLSVEYLVHGTASQVGTT
ncbi:hypothetical protein OPQ81_011966 [Rhizoctonia solani]|nr:hypothetical protein OPQ81_011966 [Rhizoctonia solani]